MRNLSYIEAKQWTNNEPVNNESFPEKGILPDRFGTLSEPSDIPILPNDLNSITSPTEIKSENQEIILT